MRKIIARYFGLKLMDLADFVMSLKPEGESYTENDEEILKRIKKTRASFK